MLPPIVSLVGKPDSGKTTLLEKLLPELKNRGYRIGTIKHHVHAFEMDTPGKDTWRHKRAGAHTVALSSPTGLGVIRDTDHDAGIAELAGRCFMDMDLVITEGYKWERMPKIEVYRSAAHTKPLDRQDDTWVAMVSDVAGKGGLPRIDINDISGLADFLVERFIRPASPRKIALMLDNDPVQLTPAEEDLIRQTVLGMVQTLRGSTSADNILITMNTTKTQDND